MNQFMTNNNNICSHKWSPNLRPPPTVRYSTVPGTSGKEHVLLCWVCMRPSRLNLVLHETLRTWCTGTVVRVLVSI
jgi:hypothetical protein